MSIGKGAWSWLSPPVLLRNTSISSKTNAFVPDEGSKGLQEGKVEAGESLAAAAIRECVEETGIRCARLKPPIHFHAGETVENPTYVFYSRQAEALECRRDVREAAPPQWVSLRRCLEMVVAHQIVDTLSIIALFAYQGVSDRRKTSAMVRLFAEADLHGHRGGLR